MSLRVLVCSDFHEKEDLRVAAIKEANSGDYDLFVNLGDYLSEEYAEQLFSDIECAAVGTTGNRDLMFSEEFIDGPVPVYNFLEADIDDEYKLILIGGDFPENVKEQIEDLIEDCDSEKVLIGSHYPPKKLGDKISSGRRIGFEQFREIILKYNPALWMSGHVHEDFGEYSLFDTKVLNAAGEETGKAFSVTIGDEGGVEEVEEIKLVE